VHAVADPNRDVLKMAVIERHKGSGAQGLGFIQGLGLRRGAMAGTVAHDHHNLVVIGADDASMLTAARAVVATWAAGWRWLRATSVRALRCRFLWLG
jgi:adenine deaminase